jgi:iron complex transport system ATP-binding protein
MNGAGKSTLLKILSGELLPDEGEVRLEGKPLSSWSLGKLAQHRAVMPQENRLTFPFLALDVVVMGRYAMHDGYPSRADERLAHSVMGALGVGHLATRLYPTLSGGERARVQLARALCQLHGSNVSQPTLLLDEPTASLDLGHQQVALAAAREFIRRERGAVCAVLHDLNLAAQYADRIVFLHEGELCADGRPEEVLKESILNRAFATQVVVTRHPTVNCPLVATQPFRDYSDGSRPSC